MCAFISLEGRLGWIGFVTRLLNLFNECGEIVNNEGGMRFARGAIVRFDAEVKLHIPGCEPRTAAPGEFGWLGEFDEAEHIDIKRAGFFFFSGGHGKLDVIDGKDFHEARKCKQVGRQKSR